MVARWSCLLVALAACGRIGFDGDGEAAGRTCGAWREVKGLFDEVNLPQVLDWDGQISSDGLDILFDSNRAAIDNAYDSLLYAAHRDARDRPFGAPRELTGANAQRFDPRSPSLWEAGGELYFIDQTSSLPSMSDTCVYVSRLDAASPNGTLAMPVTNLCFDGYHTINGIWLSDDGKRLYYDTYLDNELQIWMAEREQAPGGMFPETHEPVASLPNSLSYCKLTHDERTIYCEHVPEDKAPEQTRLWQASRRSPTGPFDAAQEVDMHELAKDMDGDPSITADERLLVYSNGTFPNADLYAMERDCSE